jgi:hypothetical protein
VVQFLLLCGVAWMVFRLSCLLVPQSVAFAASCFTLLYLPLVTFVPYHLTEILATAILTAELLLVFEIETTGPVRIAVCGLLLSALTLVRTNWGLLVFLPLAALWGRPGSKRKAALAGSAWLLLIFLLPLTVWVGRNCLIAKQFVGLTASAGTSLYHSSLQYADQESYAETGAGWEESKRVLAETMDIAHRHFDTHSGVPPSVQYELAFNRELERNAAALFRRTGIIHPLRNLTLRLLYLWSPNDFFSGWIHTLARMEQVWLAASVVIGIWLLRTDRRLYILLFPAVYITAVHFVFGAEGRYSIPARPALIPIAAYAWFRLMTISARNGLLRSCSNVDVAGWKRVRDPS